MKTGDHRKLRGILSRLPYFAGAVGLLIVIIAIRLFYLQVVEGPHYQKIATEIFVREQEILAPRGLILDRHGKVLADSREELEIILVPQYSPDVSRTVKSLCHLLPLDCEDVKNRIHLKSRQAAFEPVVLAERVPYDWAAILREHIQHEYHPESPHHLEGVELRVTPVRRYLYPELFAHALGYLREVSPNELEVFGKILPDRYTPGDLIGVAGVEKTYDLDLRGQDGTLGRVVDARGREWRDIPDLNVLREKATLPPVPGHNLHTSLDFAAQMAAAAHFQDKKGSVVALDPKTGEVLVLYSSPGFDANRITRKIDKKYWQHINLHEDRLLFNRATQAMYPPASTYKVVAALAGIESGVIDPVNTKFTCRGGMQFGNRRFKCWHRGHGTLSLVHGISQSCDVFFYNLGLKVGVDRLAKYAGIMGLGRPTGIDIPFEKSGLVPTSAWKEQRFKDRWYDSETLSVVIGQSYNQVTILQNAKMMAMLANGGYEITPHLAKEIVAPGGRLVRSVSFEKKPTEITAKSSLEWVQKGVIEVVQGYGTATRLRLSPHKIAGKTGTAQVVGHDSSLHGKARFENHALFIGMAPYDDPKIVVSVMVENGRGGSVAAAPVAMSVIDAYLGQEDGLSQTALSELQ